MNIDSAISFTPTPDFVTATLPLMSTPTASQTALPPTIAPTASPITAIVTTQINVRSGPSATYDSLGLLNPNDLVVITGKDPGGKWIQIEFANAPAGRGWAAAEFLQISNIDSLPVIGETTQAETATATPESNAISPSAVEDGDSMQAPLAGVFLSSTGSRALQVEGDISAPDGDTQDWIQFSTNSKIVILELTCSSGSMQVKLWNSNTVVDTFLLQCRENRILNITSNNIYLLNISQPAANEHQYMRYILNLKFAQ